MLLSISRRVFSIQKPSWMCTYTRVTVREHTGTAQFERTNTGICFASPRHHKLMTQLLFTFENRGCKVPLACSLTKIRGTCHLHFPSYESQSFFLKVAVVPTSRSVSALHHSRPPLTLHSLLQHHLCGPPPLPPPSSPSSSSSLLSPLSPPHILLSPPCFQLELHTTGESMSNHFC